VKLISYTNITMQGILRNRGKKQQLWYGTLHLTSASRHVPASAQEYGHTVSTVTLLQLA
jgi:hypothetical protein